MEEITYDAFISYKHGPIDSYIAKQLHKMLEHYRIPGKIRKLTGKNRIRRVFRDKEELTISSSLSEDIRQALIHSEYLIVICSPESKMSEWVQNEVEVFQSFHTPDRILPVLVKGEPQESFPDSLCIGQYKSPDNTGETTDNSFIELPAADVRGTGKRKIRRKLKKEVLHLIAPLLSCTYDELLREHRKSRIKSCMTALAAIAFFLSGFSLFLLQQSKNSDRQYQNAMESKARYLSQISGELLDEGDLAGALKTAMALSYEKDGEEYAYVPEQTAALNNCLHSYQYTASYRPAARVKLDSQIRACDGQLNSRGTFYMNFKNNRQTAFFMDCTTGSMIWELKASEITDSNTSSFLKGKILENDRVILETEGKLFYLDVPEHKVLAAINMTDIFKTDDFVYDADESCITVLYMENRTAYLRFFDLKNLVWLPDAASLPEELFSGCSENNPADIREVISDRSNKQIFCIFDIMGKDHLIQYTPADKKSTEIIGSEENGKILQTETDSSGCYLAVRFHSNQENDPSSSVENKVILYASEKNHWIKKGEYFPVYNDSDETDSGIRFFNIDMDGKQAQALFLWQNDCCRTIDLRSGTLFEKFYTDADIVDIGQMDSHLILIGLKNGSIQRRDYEEIVEAYRGFDTQVINLDISGFMYCPGNKNIIQISSGAGKTTGCNIIISGMAADNNVTDFQCPDDIFALSYHTVMENNQIKTYWSSGVVDGSEDTYTFAIWDGNSPQMREVYRFTLPADRFPEGIQIIYSNGQHLLFYKEASQKYCSGEFGGENYGYHVIDMDQKKEIFSLPGAEDYTRYIAADDGSFFISYDNQQFHVFSRENDKFSLSKSVRIENTMDNGSVSQMQFAGNNRFLIIKFHSRSTFPERFYFKVWDIQNEAWIKIDGQDTIEIADARGGLQYIFCAEEKPLIAAIMKNYTIQVFNLESRTSVSSIPFSEDESRCAAFIRHDEILIVANSEAGTISLYDPETGRALSTLHDDVWCDDVITGHGSYFAIGCHDGFTNTYNVSLYSIEDDRIYPYAGFTCENGNINLDTERIIINSDNGKVFGYDHFYSFAELKEKAMEIVGTDPLTEEELQMYLSGIKQ